MNPPSFRRSILNTLDLIKFSHTIFALPFALIAMLVAAKGFPSGPTVGLILACMVTARTAAMAFNRWIDWDFDRENPRTENRSKLASRPAVLFLCLAALALFVTATAFLNPLCFLLSPVAVVLIFGYSLTKRFTAFSHAFLGLALAAAPMGAWAAVRGDLSNPGPWCLAAAVWCWVFGFDLVYATQDVAFDRRAGLFSFPARYGIARAMLLARFLHGLTWLILAAFGLIAALPLPYWLVLGLVAGALVYEHRLCASGDVAKINLAFFQVNAVVSLLLLIGVSAGLWIKF